MPNGGPHATRKKPAADTEKPATPRKLSPKLRKALQKLTQNTISKKPATTPKATPTATPPNPTNSRRWRGALRHKDYDKASEMAGVYAKES